MLTAAMVVITAVLATSPAAAYTLYEYTGNPMSPDGAISGFFEVPSPLAPNLNNQGLGFVGFSFTDTFAGPRLGLATPGADHAPGFR